MILVWVGGLLCVMAAPAAPLCLGSRPNYQDSISKSKYSEMDEDLRRKMSHSAFPVQVKVYGHFLRVESPKDQILPIYTSEGAFYVVMRLNKGVNLLNGLPEGRYYINGKLIIIK